MGLSLFALFIANYGRMYEGLLNSQGVSIYSLVDCMGSSVKAYFSFFRFFGGVKPRQTVLNGTKLRENPCMNPACSAKDLKHRFKSSRNLKTSRFNPSGNEF